MLDLIYVALTLALFAFVGLVGKGVEKLGPRTGVSSPHDTASGKDRA